MSFDTHKHGSTDNNSVVTYRRNAHFGTAVQYTSSVFVNIQQLQGVLLSQHQHEKEALNELNQRFHLFVDRVQSLESQNAKYLAEITAARRHASGDSGIDIEWNERYLNVHSDVATLRSDKVDCESDLEWSHIQVGIYQQLMDSEKQWKEKRFLKLEQELKQSASDLNNLRASYGELERVTGNQYLERENVFKQYLAITHDWCNTKKLRKKWNLSLETLKSYIAFYKNIQSHSSRSFETSTVHTGNLEQYWTTELTESVKRIRHDFETFYATIYREMAAYYETKVEQVNKEVEQAAHYHRLEYEEFSVNQQTLQVEYEKVQYSYTHEKEILMKLEATYSKLESEFKSLELQHEERYQSQSLEVQNAEENILLMAYDIDEIQRSKVTLEAEIIIYRYLLDSYHMGGQVTVAPHKQTYGNEVTGKFLAKSRKKKSIGIKECAVNGKYITLINNSSSKDIDLSRWVLKRHIDSAPEIRYTIADGVRLKPGKELRIYSRHGSNGSEPSHQSGSSASVQIQLVNNDVASWGTGNVIETVLFNHNGEEEASYMQSIEFKKNNM